ncbi:MAG TPA: winged helix-turn-helix domain-containing protein [Phycisphaerales bacterium]|nr:winged helix-turn-helix domain-containing protein [Phycisphaerales bacterium]
MPLNVEIDDDILKVVRERGVWGESFSDVLRRAFQAALWMDPPLELRPRPTPTASSRRRNRGKVSRTTLYRPLILRFLLAQGNYQARAKDVIEFMRPQVAPKLTPVDLEPLPSNKSVQRWVNKALWARQELVKEGLVESVGWGMWRLTNRGVAAAKAI